MNSSRSTNGFFMAGSRPSPTTATQSLPRSISFSSGSDDLKICDATPAGSDCYPNNQRKESCDLRTRRHDRAGLKLFDLAPCAEFVKRSVDKTRPDQRGFH